MGPLDPIRIWEIGGGGGADLTDVTGDVTFDESDVATIADPYKVRKATVALTVAMMTGSSAGQIGHADKIPVVAAVPGKRIMFEKCVISGAGASVALTGGATATIRYYAGGSSVQASEAIAASIFTATGEREDFFRHNDDAAFATTGLAAGRAGNWLIFSGSAFTDPGGADGEWSLDVYYRLL